MDDSVAMKILDSNSNLVWKFLHSLLTKLEISELNIVEEIFALHVLEDDVVEVWILKQVDKTYDVGMLWHFEHVDFSSLLVYFDWFHVLLMDGFDGDFFAVFLVSGQLDQTELTFA